MKISRTLFVGWVFSTVLVVPVFAESNPYHIDDAVDATIRAGFHELYNLDFEKSRESFDTISNQAKEHPLVAFGKATIEWWKISVDVTENDPEISKPFLDAADQCLEIAEAKIDTGDTYGEAHLVMGSMYALLARYEAANRNWMAVYNREKKARTYLKKALKINPNAVDANMALGIFDYTLSTLPKAIRLLPGAHGSGNPDQGIKELQLAANEGIYLRLPATFLLASIFSEDLKEPHRTVQMLSRLRSEYPESPFVDLMMFIALYNQDCPVEMAVEADDYMVRVATGVYRQEFAAQGAYMTALVFFKTQHWDQAIEHFDDAITSASETSPFRIWSLLYKAYALDALGERAPAKEIYRQILSERARWQSHEYAGRRLKRPFTPNDAEMDTLLL